MPRVSVCGGEGPSQEMTLGMPAPFSVGLSLPGKHTVLGVLLQGLSQAKLGMTAE